jgi:HNH endonuclease
MLLNDYLERLPGKKKLSEVKLKILVKLWGSDKDKFPKPWVSSSELLELTGQKYFDRRIRELRDELGCDFESACVEEFSGHAWRLKSNILSSPQNREYLSQGQKTKLFQSHDSLCATCGLKISPGVRGLQADHKIPLSRGGSNDLSNWQPMCNNCNVGKRRACEGCNLDCQTCSWAFPEDYGITTMFSINEKTLRRLDKYATEIGQSCDEVVEKAVDHYLKINEDN